MASRITKKVTIGHTTDGKAIFKYFYGKTKKECQQKYEDWKFNQSKESYSDTILFLEWAETWLNIYKEDEVSETSYYGYDLCINHLCERFGQIPVCAITPAQVQHFFKTKKDLSQSMVDKLRITLNAIFETAIDNGYADRNPVKNIPRPKGKAPEEKRVLTPEQFRTLKTLTHFNRDGLGVFLILSTGCRRGELMGLKGTDFDFKNNRLKIQRTIIDSLGHPEVKDTLKNGDTFRIIPLDPKDAAVIKNNVLFHKDDFIFKSKSGGLLAPRQWARYTLKRFYASLEETHPEIPQLNPHELRHTYGTMLFKAGNDPYVVQKIMGHKSLAITMNIYVHDDVEDVESRMKFIEVPDETIAMKEKLK